MSEMCEINKFDTIKRDQISQKNYFTRYTRQHSCRTRDSHPSNPYRSNNVHYPDTFARPTYSQVAGSNMIDR